MWDSTLSVILYDQKAKNPNFKKMLVDAVKEATGNGATTNEFENMQENTILKKQN